MCRAFALAEINRMREEGHDIYAAVASRTDEPSWARICMKHLILEDGTTLQECFGTRVEIAGESKAKHLERLRRQTGVEFEEMAFFDNERWNIQDVSRKLPGVKCVYTPNGMTRKAWEDTLAKFGL